jgi:hypothetical protein
VIPSFNFNGRDAHVNLIEEGRLIAGGQYIGRAVALDATKHPLGSREGGKRRNIDDAEELAKYERVWISWRRLYPRKAVHSHFVWLD